MIRQYYFILWGAVCLFHNYFSTKLFETVITGTYMIFLENKITKQKQITHLVQPYFEFLQHGLTINIYIQLFLWSCKLTL